MPTPQFLDQLCAIDGKELSGRDALLSASKPASPQLFGIVEKSSHPTICKIVFFRALLCSPFGVVPAAMLPDSASF